MKRIDRKIGDLQVWWIPQIPMKPFKVEVESPEQGAFLLKVLAEYDLFQFRNRIKPDYSNTGGLRRWCRDNGEGIPGWEDWYAEDTGEDLDEYIERIYAKNLDNKEL